MRVTAAGSPSASFLPWCRTTTRSTAGSRTATGYGGIRVLDRLDLDLTAGRITAVVGPNGAGKSTLLKALAGLLPRDGLATLDGQVLPSGSATAAVRAGLVLVAEGRHLFPRMTVLENLQLGGWLLPAAERAARVDRALARALVGRPRLLMLDEPSLGLAPRLVDEVFALVRKIRDEDVTVLLVEQNVARALAVADDAHVLERGRLVASGRGTDLLRSNLVQAAYLGAR